MKKILVIMLLSFGILGCAPTKAPNISRPQIVNGQELSSDHPGRYSLVALVEKRDGVDVLFCSGVVIAPQLVATAAHCTNKEISANPIQVYFGDPKEPGPKELRDVVEFKTFRDSYRENVPYFPIFDISIVRFTGELPAGFRPIPIVPTTEMLTSGQVVWPTGYGQTATHVFDAGQQRLTADVKIQKYYSNAFAQGLIAYDSRQGKGSCYGDSGGPMYLERDGQWYVAGIANGRAEDFGVSGRCETGNGLYTSLTFYKGWIEDAMAESLQGPHVDTPSLGVWPNELQQEHANFNDWCQDFNLPRQVWDGLNSLFKNWGTRDCSALQERLLRSSTVNGIFGSVYVVPSLPGIQRVMLKARHTDEGLSGSDLGTMVSLLNRNPTVTELVLEGYRLDDLRAIAQLKHINSLTLRGAGLVDISALSSLQNLSVLDLSNNKLEDISTLSHLNNLKKLNLRFNNLTNVSSLTGLQGLEELDLSVNPLTDKTCPVADPEKRICRF